MPEERGQGWLALDFRQQAIRKVLKASRFEQGLERAGSVDQARRRQGGDKDRAALGERRRKGGIRQQGGEIA